MRNSSPYKSLKIEIMDGAFFRGLGKTKAALRRLCERLSQLPNALSYLTFA
jgi:hypothetical protein